MSHDGESLPRLDSEGNVAQNPIFFFRRISTGVREPHIAKFNLSARRGKRMYLGRRHNRHGFIKQLEDAFGSSHGALQYVEFFAEILNWAKEALGVHHEGHND